MSTDILLLIIAIVVVVVALFLVPTLLQLKGAIQRADEFMREAQRELLPMARELREASEHIRRLSADAEMGVSKAGQFFESLGDVGDLLHRASHIWRGDGGAYVGNAIGLWLGIRAASKAFLKQLNKSSKGGD